MDYDVLVVAQSLVELPIEHFRKSVHQHLDSVDVESLELNKFVNNYVL